MHHESQVLLQAPVERAFAFLDDFKALSAHMEKRSAMMMGSRMSTATDELGGRAVGAFDLYQQQAFDLLAKIGAGSYPTDPVPTAADSPKVWGVTFSMCSLSSASRCSMCSGCVQMRRLIKRSS